jgi:hypothetical protein
MNKIRVAFIYHESNVVLSGSHYDNTYYHFFMKALKRNEQIKVTYFATKDTFDSVVLKDKFDIILLWQNSIFGMPKKIFNIKNLKIPVIAKYGDPNDAKNSIKYHKEWKIDHYFHFLPPSVMAKFYPKHFQYKSIHYGLEKSVYQNINSFKNRIKNKILNSGGVGSNKIANKIYWFLRDRSDNNPYVGYKLRTMCNELPYVNYTSTLKHKYVNDNYTLLLQKYCAGIAATSDSPTIKYWEIAASGCLTFMEITDKNCGKEIIEFEDGKSAIFINEKNYKEKFQEFLDDPNNPKWEKIAKNGRNVALEEYNNDKGIQSLVNLMKKLLNEND